MKGLAWSYQFKSVEGVSFLKLNQPTSRPCQRDERSVENLIQHHALATKPKMMPAIVGAWDCWVPLAVLFDAETKAEQVALATQQSVVFVASVVALVFELSLYWFERQLKDPTPKHVFGSCLQHRLVEHVERPPSHSALALAVSLIYPGPHVAALHVAFVFVQQAAFSSVPMGIAFQILSFSEVGAYLPAPQANVATPPHLVGSF